MPRQVGILGTGDVGLAFVRGCLLLGDHVLLGTRKIENDKSVQIRKNIVEKADENEKKSLEKVLPDHNVFNIDTFENVTKKSEILFLCVSWEAVEPLCKSIEPYVKNKIIFDVCNPLTFEPNKPPKLAIGHVNSCGEVVQNICKEAKVVKCWNIITNAYMCNAKRTDLGGSPTMFYCGNDKEAKNVCVHYLKAWHWDDTCDVGDITKSRYLEPLAMLWIDHLFQTGFSSSHAFKLLRVGKSDERLQHK